ncbi:MAG: hypothetical protein ACP5OG_01330 [Candidatus Nanoarchaeia archaeon]
MRRLLTISSLLAFVSLILLVSALDYSGDGTYSLKKGEIITLDNGWKIQMKTIVMYATGPWIVFDILDPEGNKVREESMFKYEGRKKFGSDEVLKMEIEILDMSEKLEEVSPTYLIYENVKINIVSIDEKLPGSAGEKGLNLKEDIIKEITYKNSRTETLAVGENVTLENGYVFKLERFMQGGSIKGNPVFSFFDPDGSLIDNTIILGKNIEGTWGSFIKIKDYDEYSVDLLIINGSMINFGTGWNLFSIHLEDGDGFGTILESSCNNATIWSWNNEIKDYESIGHIEESVRIPSNKGLWVKIQTKVNTDAEEDCVILVSGTKPVTTNNITLKSGWNIIPSPMSAFGKIKLLDDGSKFIPLTFNDILGDCRVEKGPWEYAQSDDIQPSHSEEVQEDRFSAPLGNIMRINRGYFIKVIDDCTLGDK